jgi:hypothetical protein
MYILVYIYVYAYTYIIGEAEMMEEMKPKSDIEIKDTLKLLLNEIRYLITNNDIKNDTEFSKELQSLGRKGTFQNEYIYIYIYTRT